MSLVHADKFGLNSDSLAIDGAADSVAKHEDPLVDGRVFKLGNQDAVFVRCHNLLKTFHVLDVLLVDTDVPENDAHIVALGFAESKDQSLREVAPHVIWLDVGKQNVCVDSQGNTQAEAFPTNGVNHTSEGGHSQTTKMVSERRVELNDTFVAFRSVNQRTSDSEDVTVWIPLDTLDEHASVDENRTVIGQASHHLHATALVSNAKSSRVLILIFVRKSLTV